MRNTRLVRVGSLLLIGAGVAACSDPVTVEPIRPPTSASFAASAGDDSNEPTTVSPRLEEINALLARTNAKVRIAKAELLMNDQWNGVTSTLIVANDRLRGIGAEWVKGDPRRDGNAGVTYQIAANLGVLPAVINPDRATARLATLGEVNQQIEEGMGAWRTLTCSSAPITAVPVPAGTDPNMLDNFFSGLPLGANYAQTADIVHGGFKPRQFFRNIAAFFGQPPADGDNIIGITFSFVFEDANGDLTDIDRNKKADLGLSEIFFNSRFVYDNSGLVDLRVIDFFSVIAHESGHAVGLGHLGKIFITKHDVSDGSLSLSEVKFAPRALMNAVYFAGRDEIMGTDNSQFCEIWASK